MQENSLQGTEGAIAPLLLSALQSAKVGVALKDTNGRYMYLSGLPSFFPNMPAVEASDELLFGEDWLPRIAEVQEQVMREGEKKTLELIRSTNAQFCACQCTVQRYRLGNSRYAILMTFIDLTPERKREDTLKALLRELSHRSKNLLAIVQGIAAQTARQSESQDVFLTKFRGRIAALSSAQDLVTDSNWHGARFFELAARQLARYVDEHDPRIEMTGTDLMLSPNGATHVGLALHELIVNSTSHGALASEKGTVKISCRQTGTVDGNPVTYEIGWDEDYGEDSPAGKRAAGEKRFGSTVLERIVPASLNGEATYEIGKSHTSYRLRFPVP
ncbi:MAG: sensor histidine kinase [Actinomycetes bacterium]